MKRKRIVIIGAGGMAREVASTLHWINRGKPAFDFLGYVISDLSQLGPRDTSDQLIGDFRWLEQNRDCVDALALGVGSPATRLKLAADLSALLTGIEWPVLIHPTAVIDLDSARLGEGCFIGARVTATVNIELEPFALCNFGSTLGHEARVGRGSVVNPGANISGGVVLGEGVMIGSGAQVLQYLHVGSGAVVGAGAVVTRDVSEGITVVGVPARPRAIVEEVAQHREQHCKVRASLAVPILPDPTQQDTAPPTAVEHLTFAPWPYFEANDIEAAAAVLRSGKVNYWTGQEGRLFEAEFAQATGSKHAICVANGTLALELALHGLGIGRGDEVITTSRTFIASASCVVMRGARPVCVDVDPDSQNITAETIERAITPRTRAIIAVHLAGWPCDMDPILKLASAHGLKVIEDCAQAQGALYKGRPVGSMGDVAAFSFCQDKIMTTGGEGGMLTTSHSDVWERAWSYKDHGKNYNSVYNREHRIGFRWLHDSFGTNWRMTEMQSAMGRVLLKKVPEWIETRRRNADKLTSYLSGVPGLRIPTPPQSCHHAYYKYYTFVRPERLQPGWDRDKIMQVIVSEGVPCFVGSCSEIYLEKAFVERRKHERLPIARHLGETSLMFLVHPTLSDRHMALTCQAVGKVMSQATKREVGRVGATSRSEATLAQHA